MAVILHQRIASVMVTGQPFTADDVTLDGLVTLDSTHAPNARQNGIGSVFRELSVQGYIRKTGNTANSRAPHRKGGLIREWQATESGIRWAGIQLDIGAA